MVADTQPNRRGPCQTKCNFVSLYVNEDDAPALNYCHRWELRP